MITSGQVLNATLTQTQFRLGYDEREVDDALDQATRALRQWEEGGSGRGTLAADAVHRLSFTTTQVRKGYDAKEVDDLLDEIATTLRHYEGGGQPTAPTRSSSPPPWADLPDRPTPPPSPTTSGESFAAKALRWLRGDPKA